jgi:predicted transcriptional regulator
MNSISHEIRTNYKQTHKVLSFLTSKGYVDMRTEDRSHKIMITKQGVLFIRRFNGYYAKTYADIIQEHYRFGRLPAWFRAEV